MKGNIISLIIVLLFISGIAISQDVVDNRSFEASFNYGKTVAVFGGSHTMIPESESAKMLWKNHLGMSVSTFGVSGAGFSSLQGKSLQQQVDEAGRFDIYILWASTNDYNHRREIGKYTDYTEFDNFDQDKLTTQAGGINYCIKRIYEKNPHAIIYFFTSSKVFNNRGGYDPLYPGGLNQYVEMQKKVCKLHGIPVLDQFQKGGYNIYNKDLYYYDPLHMNTLGYTKLGKLQVSFLAFPK